jgi:hypothetical protein
LEGRLEWEGGGTEFGREEEGRDIVVKGEDLLDDVSCFCKGSWEG